MQKNKVLVLYAHPSQRRSEVNQPLFDVLKHIEGVTSVDLYYEYPTYNIDIDKEQQRLIEHDVIIFQFPLYWYSTPSILKEWQDLVLEYGFAYGQEGTALQGKKFLCALTAGGNEEAYQSQGYNHFTIRQLLQPLEQTATLTGMQYLAPFALFGARTAQEDGRVDKHLKAWVKLLNALVANQLDYHKAAQVDKLCHCLDDILLGGTQ
ncbi:NAD(P)H-dependent oxidoreductase [Vibrio ostreicida]|uniref:NAD(P)H-dependent oxidoreductase n=1 Tax=Vibrio ostreicida TaxID=526588 RepID=A0ABT8C247_9VIBR|nr:NAD(P)H-dependent oxidoreductase [Vibrio ostreicida]MDN3612413.1 NAD(P)H-dependent oxidoreductase [Vibrio ostreicida]NPD09818.1 flavodoxin family protein [Vibrio ostreicida]